MGSLIGDEVRKIGLGQGRGSVQAVQGGGSGQGEGKGQVLGKCRGARAARS